jgi:hypothetical protein
MGVVKCSMIGRRICTGSLRSRIIRQLCVQMTNFRYVQIYPNGGGKVLHAWQEDLDRLSEEQNQTFAEEFVTESFRNYPPTACIYWHTSIYRYICVKHLSWRWVERQLCLHHSAPNVGVGYKRPKLEKVPVPYVTLWTKTLLIYNVLQILG